MEAARRVEKRSCIIKLTLSLPHVMHVLQCDFLNSYKSFMPYKKAKKKNLLNWNITKRRFVVQNWTASSFNSIINHYFIQKSCNCYKLTLKKLRTELQPKIFYPNQHVVVLCSAARYDLLFVLFMLHNAL